MQREIHSADSKKEYSTEMIEMVEQSARSRRLSDSSGLCTKHCSSAACCDTILRSAALSITGGKPAIAGWSLRAGRSRRSICISMC